MKIEDVARIAGVSRRTLFYWMSHGYIPRIKGITTKQTLLVVGFAREKRKMFNRDRTNTNKRNMGKAATWVHKNW